MTENEQKDSGSAKSSWRKLGVASWFTAISWGLGCTIFGWLLAGSLYSRDYPNLTSWDKLGWADWSFAGVSGLLASCVSLYFSARNNKNKSVSYLQRIFISVLPALFLVLAFTALVLTLTTYNGYWAGSRQGITTALGALFAAVGVVMTVSVNYRMGEENRLAQQWNLEAQLSHQKALEDEKGEREQQKHDAELVKNLSERLNKIIKHRYSDNPQERSASYFQLAALYQDWEVLSESSKTIERQRDSQQKNILQILFGVYQEIVPSRQKRTQVEIQALNSIIRDIFPDYKKGESQYSSQDENWIRSPKNRRSVKFYLDSLNLQGLDFSSKDLRNASLVGANLNGANLSFTHLEGANLRGAKVGSAKLENSHFEGSGLAQVEFFNSDLSGVFFDKNTILECANFYGAILTAAHFEGVELIHVRLEGVENFKSAFFYNHHAEGWREEFERDRYAWRLTIDQLSKCKTLPMREILGQAAGFTAGLVDEIYSQWESSGKNW